MAQHWRCAVPMLSVLVSACTDVEKMAKIEKENKELRAKVEQQNRVVDLDTQGKCGTAAKRYLNENWTVDKGTMLLDYHNHFNRSLGKCFILVEWHYADAASKTGSWFNSVKLSDVYENLEYGELSEHTRIVLEPTISSEKAILDCHVSGAKCKTSEEFGELVQHFMSE